MLDGMFTREGRRSLGTGTPDVRCELIRNYGNINENTVRLGSKGLCLLPFQLLLGVTLGTNIAGVTHPHCNSTGSRIR